MMQADSPPSSPITADTSHPNLHTRRQGKQPAILHPELSRQDQPRQKDNTLDILRAFTQAEPANGHQAAQDGAHACENHDPHNTLELFEKHVTLDLLTEQYNSFDGIDRINALPHIKYIDQSKALITAYDQAEHIEDDTLLDNLEVMAKYFLNVLQQLMHQPHSFKIQCYFINLTWALWQRYELRQTKDYWTIGSAIYTMAGNAFDQHHMIEKATPYYLTAHSYLMRQHAPEPLRVATSFHNLGNIWSAQDHHQRARQCYHKALDIKLTHAPTAERTHALTYQNLAVLYEKMTEYPTALLYYQFALTVFEKHRTQHTGHLFSVYFGMGTTYFHLEEYQNAIACLNKAVANRCTTHPNPGIECAGIWRYIATSYNMLNDHDNALLAYTKVMVVLEKCAPHDHAIKASTSFAIASTYFNKGDYGLAITHAEQGKASLAKISSAADNLDTQACTKDLDELLASAKAASTTTQPDEDTMGGDHSDASSHTDSPALLSQSPAPQHLA